MMAHASHAPLDGCPRCRLLRAALTLHARCFSDVAACQAVQGPGRLDLLFEELTGDAQTDAALAFLATCVKVPPSASHLRAAHLAALLRP